MADSAQDRNLPASAKKIQRSRAEGQVPRSRDLQHFAMMVGGGAALAIGGAWLADALQKMLSQALRFDAYTVSHTGLMGERLSQLTGTFLMLMLPVCGLLFAA